MEENSIDANDVTSAIERILDSQIGSKIPHSPANEKPRPPNGQNQSRPGDTMVCKHWMLGRCRMADACQYLHELVPEKVPRCRYFLSAGLCSVANCPFLHIDPAWSLVPECPWYRRGFCRHGPKCKKRHVSTVLCPDYSFGICAGGDQCRNAHPSFELPAADASAQSLIECHACGQIGHKASVCPSFKAKMSESTSPAQHHGQPRPLDQIMCFKCKEMGHYANKCPNSDTVCQFKRTQAK